MAIARMKKVFIVGLEDNKEDVLRIVQRIGVLHTEPLVNMNKEAEKRNSSIEQEAKRIGAIYKSLSLYGKGVKKGRYEDSLETLLRDCERAIEDVDSLRSRRTVLEKSISDLTPWSNFEPGTIKDLEKDGVFVQRFRVDGKISMEIAVPDDVFIEVVSRKPNLEFFTIRLGRPFDVTWASQLRHPEESLREAQEELATLTGKEAEIVKNLTVFSEFRDEVKQHYVALLSELDFAGCLGTLHSEGFLFGLQGWVPEESERALLGEINTSGLALHAETRDPAEGEAPPVLLKNNWFFKKTEPLLKLYGLPGYNDIDPSYFFAPFMILFFGICLGDAGYGAVFLGASIWIRKRFGHLTPFLPMVMRLCEAFSISAVIIGLITGSVFGHWVFSRDWILVDIDKDHGDPMILFYASIGLGLVHLSFSYIIGYLQSSSRYDRFQRLGLLGVLWGGVSLISQRIWFSDPSSFMALWLYYGGMGFLACGVLLTFLFASDSKKLMLRFGLGLWSVYGLTGLVGDLLSYARLFGLGIATTAIASVMNDLAGMVVRAAGPMVGGALGALVLILGHTFNLLLSVLGSTVHSARLHFVEAFKSFFQPRGTEYKPFKLERG